MSAASTNTVESIVVGADGSAESLHAVAWAAEEAARRDRPLRIIHAFLWPLLTPPTAGPPPASYLDALRDAAQANLVDAARHAELVAPGLAVHTELVAQAAAAALLDATQDGALLVVGCRGLGGFTGLLAGSVSVQVASHGHGPVVVVRPAQDTGGRPAPNAGRVVVGVDDSPDAEHAVRFAFEEAGLRGVGLTVVHAYLWPSPDDDGAPLPAVHDLDDLAADEPRALSETLRRWRAEHPDVPVDVAVRQGRPAAVLTRAAAGAPLLVVGSRGRGGFTGLLLGSVSQAVLHHAPCPVAVIRHR